MMCLGVWRFSVVNDCLAVLTGPTLWTAWNLKPSMLTPISVRTFLNKASVFSSSVSLTFNSLIFSRRVYCSSLVFLSLSFFTCSFKSNISAFMTSASSRCYDINDFISSISSHDPLNFLNVCSHHLHIMQDFHVCLDYIQA